MTKQIAVTPQISEQVQQKLKALFVGETITALVKDGNAVFSNGSSQYATNAAELPDGTYHVVVQQDAIMTSEVVKPAVDGVVKKAAKAIKDAVTPAPRITRSGASSYNPSPLARQVR